MEFEGNSFCSNNVDQLLKLLMEIILNTSKENRQVHATHIEIYE